MDYSIKTGNIASIRTHCLILPVFLKKTLDADAKAVDTALEGLLIQLKKSGDFDGSTDQTQIVHTEGRLAASRVLFVGCGEPKDFSITEYTSMLSNALQALNCSAATNACLCLRDIKIKDAPTETVLKTTSETVNSKLYSFNAFKTADSIAAPLASQVNRLSILLSGKGKASYKQAINQGVAIAAGVNLARDLGNMPPNICTPSYLANEARKLVKSRPNATCKVVGEKELKTLGAGAFLAVSQGSEQEGKLIVLEYKGGKKTDAPHVLVGKGITFDSGGISIKPSPDMDQMKFDMGGAASVIGTFHSVLEMGLAINLVVLVAAAENMPSGKAARPGDIITSLSGKTIEILNTDAEGRLVLCDALTYAERFKPASVIDVATLTGACIVALGHHATALLSNHDDLANDLLNAGTQACDRAWQLPLWDEYAKQLCSPFADIANIGGRAAGTITAACFLSCFTKSYKWAHLDIAGVAWLSGAKDKCSTGRPVPLLTQYLINESKK